MIRPDHAETERLREVYARRDDTPSLAGVYSAFNPQMLCVLQQRERALVGGLRRLGISSLERKSVLEVGCGDANVLAVFQRLGASTLTGVDLSDSRIGMGRQSHPSFNLIVGNASELPFDDGSFDVTAQFTLLSSVMDPGLRSAISAEMIRVTKPGGIIISYDLSPVPLTLRVVRAIAWRIRGARTARASASHSPAATEIQSSVAQEVVTPISREQLSSLFHGLKMTVVPANAAFDLCSYGSHARALLSDIMSAMPALRMHELAFFQVGTADE